MSLLTQARAEATQEIEVCGWWFRLRRIVSREMECWRGYSLLLVARQSKDVTRLARELRELAAQGDDLTGALPAAIAEYNQIAQDMHERAMEPQVAAKGEAARAAILAAGVVAWGRSPADGAPVEWRPVRIEIGAAHDGIEGDGVSTPDVIPARMLPGGGSTEAALVTAILTMSQAGEAEARRLAAFRRSPGVG